MGKARRGPEKPGTGCVSCRRLGEALGGLVKATHGQSSDAAGRRRNESNLQPSRTDFPLTLLVVKCHGR